MNDNKGKPKNRFSIVESNPSTGKKITIKQNSSNSSTHEPFENNVGSNPFDSVIKLKGVKLMEPQYSPRDLERVDVQPIKNSIKHLNSDENTLKKALTENINPAKILNSESKMNI